MSADRLTELHKGLDFLGYTFYNSIGIIQQYAPPSAFGAEHNEKKKEFNATIKDMALQIAKTGKTMQDLIQSLQENDSTEEQQKSTMVDLENKNHQSGQMLRKKVEHAEAQLTKIREALEMIAQDRFSEN